MYKPGICTSDYVVDLDFDLTHRCQYSGYRRDHPCVLKSTSILKEVSKKINNHEVVTLKVKSSVNYS